MPGSAGPRHGFTWGYSAGETGWGLGAFNPNFAKLEALLHLSVTSITSTPPGTPVAGMVYIVGGSPSGAWAGHAGAVAAYYTTGWLFITPVTGVRAWNVSTATYWRYSGSAWVEEPEAGDLFGPGGAVTGAVPVYADATGKLLADSGVAFSDLLQIGTPLVPANFISVDLAGRAIDSGISVGGLGTGNVTGPLTSATGNLAGYADTSGTLLLDSGVPAADVVLADGVLVTGNALTVNVDGDLVDAGLAVEDIVIGSAGAVAGNLPVYADVSGTLLADSGLAPAAFGDVDGPAGSTTGHLAAFADASGKVLADSAVPAVDLILAGGVLVEGNLVTVNADGDLVDAGVAAGDTGGTSVTVAETAPLDPGLGDLWWDSNDGQLYVFFDSYWVAATNIPAGPNWTVGSGLSLDTGTSPATISLTTPALPLAGGTLTGPLTINSGNLVLGASATGYITRPTGTDNILLSNEAGTNLNQIGLIATVTYVNAGFVVYGAQQNWGGIVVGAPAGGNKGSDTINAVTVYGNNVVLTSDAHLKESVEPLPPCLDLVRSIEPVAYHWKPLTPVETPDGRLVGESSPEFAERQNWGFLAQDLVAATGVHRKDGDIEAMDVAGLIATLWQAVRELSDKVVELEGARK